MVKLMARAGCRYIYTGLESLNPESIKAMNKGQNRVKDIDEVIRRCFKNGIILSFGLIVGSDGDTNEYLEKLPEYLADLQYFSITFLGIVCPYPETPFYRLLEKEGRLLPKTISRDYDGYTLCHRPLQLEPSDVIYHFKKLAKELGTFKNVARHYRNKLFMSDLPNYRRAILGSGLEIKSISNPINNNERQYIAGLDAVEEWDSKMMNQLQLVPQYLS
jgi:radical SAM superfamily enzyme YgiQ (UPF0313 family)